MARAPVYLDCHATTPLDPRVLEAMLPYFTEHFGNPASSTHAWGWKAQAAVEQARREVASIIGAAPRDIYFTSGATESNNLAIAGAVRAMSGRTRVVVSAIEHKSVLEPASRLGREGFEVVRLPVGRDGIVDLEEAARAIDGQTALVSVMAANNEIGVIQPIAEIGRMARDAGALFHVDAAQAVGKIPLDVEAMCVDLLSMTAHKLYGPKGCGAIYVRRRLPVEPMLVGGGHERGLRAGTLNVPGIVGFGRACAIAAAGMDEECRRVATLRDALLDGLRSNLGTVVVNGTLERRLANNLHVSFPDVDGESLLIAIGDIAVSAGSACGSASGEPSHVLQAISGDAPVPSASVRFGLGRFTTADEIAWTVERFTTVVRHLRQKAHA